MVRDTFGVFEQVVTVMWALF